jgi:hypothetical protein
MPVNDVFLPLNAHTVKNSPMENVRISAIVDFCSTKVFASLEDALQDMLIMDLEDVLEVHQVLDHRALQLPALPDNSS